MPYDVLRESMGELRKLKSYERISYGLSDDPGLNSIWWFVCKTRAKQSVNLSPENLGKVLKWQEIDMLLRNIKVPNVLHRDYILEDTQTFSIFKFSLRHTDCCENLKLKVALIFRAGGEVSKITNIVRQNLDMSVSAS